MTLPSVVDAPIGRFRDNPLNTRKVYDLSTLKPSIAREGVLQAVGAVEDGDALYLLWGNRRYRSVLELHQEGVPGFDTIPARIFPGPLEPGKAELLTVLENAARDDLRPSETATGYQLALDAGELKLGQLAALVGKTSGHVSKSLAILKLVPPLIDLIDRGLIPATSAPALAKLSEAAQLKKAEAITEKVSRDELARSLGNKKGGGSGNPVRRLKRGKLRLLFSGSDDLNVLLTEVDEIRKAINRAVQEKWDFATLAKVLRRISATS